MARIRSTHHVFGVEHLLRELRHCQCAILLGSAGRQWSEACHEEVQTRKWNEIDSDFAEVAVQLAREAQAASHATHRGTHEVIEVSVGGCCQLQCTEADVVQSFIVQKKTLIGVFDELME